MSTDTDEAPTIPVSSLAEATRFYEAALQPLGYQYISRVRHETAHSTSEAVGLGPVNSGRVDLFLSHSLSNPDRVHGSRHICFPATSRAAVRDFYAAALDAGGKPFTAPSDSSEDPGVFQTIVSDPDGNRVEVFVQATASSSSGEIGDAPAEAQPSNVISKWATEVAASVSGGSHGSGSRSPPNTAMMPGPLPAAGASAAPATNRAPSSVASSSRTRKDSAAHGSDASKSSNNSAVNNKTLIGAAIGVAAAGALAYSMFRSRDDSSRRERDFSSRMAARESLRSEAREYRPVAASTHSRGIIEMHDYDASHPPPHPQDRAMDDRSQDRYEDMGDWAIKYRGRRRSSAADRDSGYHSHNEARRYRSIAYPAPAPAGEIINRRGDSVSAQDRRALEYQPWDSKSAAASQRPPSQRSRSQSQRRSTYSEDTIKVPSRAHTYAEPLSQRERREGSQSGAPARSRSVVARSHVTVSQPPSPPSIIMPSRRSSSSAGTAKTARSGRTTLPPSAAGAASALSQARRAPLPVSEAGSKVSRYTYQTANTHAERVPLPASSAGSRRSRATAASVAAERVPLPPSEAGSGGTRLTKESLKAFEVPLPPSEVAYHETGKLEDMATIVPDDSISCVASRGSRRSHSTRRSRVLA